MEDEDSENGLVDTWSQWEEAYFKKQSMEAAVAQMNNSNTCLDDSEENREDCFYSAYSLESDGNGNSNANIKNVIKGLKNNILKQKQENQSNICNDIESTQQEAQINDTTTEEKENTNKKEEDKKEVKTEKMTEYTQYLGLQPSSKLECNKTSPSQTASTSSEINLHQYNHSSVITPPQETADDDLELPNPSASPEVGPSCNSKSESADNTESLQTDTLENESVHEDSNDLKIVTSPSTSEVEPTDNSKAEFIDDIESPPISTPASVCNAKSEAVEALEEESENELQIPEEETLASNFETSPTHASEVLSSVSFEEQQVDSCKTPFTYNSRSSSSSPFSGFASEEQSVANSELAYSHFFDLPSIRRVESPRSQEQPTTKKVDQLPAGKSDKITASDIDQSSSSNFDQPSTSTSNQNLSSSFGQPSTSKFNQPLTSSSIKPSTSSSNKTSTKGHKSRKSSSEFPKITRKVYLCAACDTYFENWNLFLHMREVHDRYICLFCLGMFGDANRLSYHLAKKHSTPETVYNTAEEFYRVFRGSCYVVCCSCQKMFTESDNFEEHECPTDQTKKPSELACSVCKRVGTHMKTCSLAPEKEDETAVLQPVASVSNTKPHGVVVDSLAPSQTVTGVRRQSQRTIKHKHDDDVYLYTDIVNRRAKRTKSQNLSESMDTSDHAVSESSQSNIPISKPEAHQENTFQNTIAETQMDVSQCTQEDNQGDTCTNDLQDNSSQNISFHDSELWKSDSAKNINDSVTETNMEASKYVNNSTNLTYADKTMTESLNNGTIESSNPKSEDDVRLNEAENEREETKECGVDNNSAQEESDSDSESKESDNPNSPVNQPVLSPNHEKRETTPEKRAESTKSEAESKPPVSGGSLIIKFSKTNETFSISSSSPLLKGETENQDTSKESEENNNAEVSDSKKSVPEENDAVKGEHNSDSDSDKQPVVDSDSEMPLGNILIEPDVNKQVNLDLELNNIEPEKVEEKIVEEEKPKEPDDGIPLAGEEIPLMDLNVDNLLENIEIEILLKLCIQTVCGICVYCNHARCIAVNGKQLGLHMLAQHRFQPQHPAIVIQQEQFTARVKKCLGDLESYYFNLDSYNSKDGTYNVLPTKRYECFHCRIYTTAHKELYLHNRKHHQKTILVCVMCKSTFYSYSELVCHLCPGVYGLDNVIQYRCCLCSTNTLPSAFRLMVHVRKKHHACDVCLETTGNQQRLANHVWKHKLNHFCYRCGIAYRNKQDITKHLFWKHGTESVLCKKCLQKKWPHVYHFCTPPPAFECEECGLHFTKAVALKVHKRTHTGDFPYTCSKCPETLISKKLLAKHEQSHREPVLPPFLQPQFTAPGATGNQTVTEEEVLVDVCGTEAKEQLSSAEPTQASGEPAPKEPVVKKVVDVYDLPPLNLSSDSDSDSDDDKKKEDDNKKKEDEQTEKVEGENKSEIVESVDVASVTIPINDAVVEVERNEEEKKQEEQIMDGIWDNFKSYAASLDNPIVGVVPMEVDGKQAATDGEKEKTEQETPVDEIQKKKKEEEEKQQQQPVVDPEILKAILTEHDYWVVYEKETEAEKEVEPAEPAEPVAVASPKNTDDVDAEKQSLDAKPERTPSPMIPASGTDNDSAKKKVRSPKKKKQQQSGNASSSDSSSDSDASSCSCGSNCSCSSSSSSSCSSSSSSSDSESSGSEAGSPRKKRKKAEEAAKQHTEKPGEGEQQSEQQQGNAVAQATDQVDGAPEPAESAIVDVAPPAPPRIMIVESDLDTTETETDEDFYDENPQLMASKLMAEKRNKLLSFSSTPATESSSALPVNNGAIDPSAPGANESMLMNDSLDNPAAPSKRKAKTRRRRRGGVGRSARGRGRKQPAAATTPKTVNPLRLNIPKNLLQKKGYASVPATPAALAPAARRLSVPAYSNLGTPYYHHEMMGQMPESPFAAVDTAPSVGGSGSETDATKRSKRKRVPKRFYGDSSDEETRQQQQMLKIRRVEAPLGSVKAQSPAGNKSLTYKQTIQQQQQLLLHQQQQHQQLILQQQQQQQLFIQQQQQQQLLIQQQQHQLQLQQEQLLQQQRLQQQQQQMQVSQQPDDEEDEEEDDEEEEDDDDEEEKGLVIAGASGSQSNDSSSSSDSSDSDNEEETAATASTELAAPTNAVVNDEVGFGFSQYHGIPQLQPVHPERQGHLYCYCQSQYDEVSEMIACDGDDCQIEWFHFQCVQIVKPPKGKWYCPDCRRRHQIPDEVEEDGNG